ncbi:Uncharacterized protein MSYG_0407 [Malassezia sympodialis ATCC 42132]|uniref:Uncharacterized protein n=2 Tax=Malassezia sympodialis (strain ATCC 42132) TaxID=1230383 RepID=A0A1M8A0T6_MALS4|nr:Uncharacterized protein MSYG_0407 [Malassezia sympodialis ATCC 42132]
MSIPSPLRELFRGMERPRLCLGRTSSRPASPDENASTPTVPCSTNAPSELKKRRGSCSTALDLLSLRDISAEGDCVTVKAPLKSNLCAAEMCLDEAPVSYFSSSVPRSLSSSLEDLSVSPPGVMTPHCLLFPRTADMPCSDAAPETATPGSSWSSSSKRSESVESPQSSVTSIGDIPPDSKPDNASESTVVAVPCTHATLAEPRPSQSSLPMRRRSRSDVGVRSDSWGIFRGMELDDSPTCSPSPTALPETPSSPVSPIDSPPCPPNLMPTLEPVRPSDFSAFVSGIGEPIDPDLESTTVEQLKVFRQHARSRSVGPRDFRSGSDHEEHDPSLDDTRIENTLGLSPRRWRMSSPRPPLALVRDTSQIPALTGLGTALCNPGYILRPKQDVHDMLPADTLDDPPRSPRLVSTSTALDDVPSVGDMDGVPVLSDSITSNVDEQGYQEVRSRRQRQRDRHSSGYAPRPAVEDPVPPSLDVFEESKPESPCVDEDRRGRSRSRSSHSNVQTSQTLASKTVKSGSVLGVSHRRGSQRRRQGMSYAAIASQGRETPSEPRGRGRNRGRREAIKKLATSQDLAELSASTRETIVPHQENTCGEEPVDMPRVRLLSNSAHLLMLSLEMAMIKNHKIYTPLKPRWGKHRDDDFHPVPTIEQRLNKYYGASHEDLPKGIRPGSMYQYVDDHGSRLKYPLGAM